ncbi:acetylcholinesterase-like [Ornithodoros turicata]|uniref:acetylcholinesterase-like n=1 Tax=Ornithodoros turicata TaxID=34597 RepID=UPI0031395096
MMVFLMVLTGYFIATRTVVASAQGQPRAFLRRSVVQQFNATAVFQVRTSSGMVSGRLLTVGSRRLKAFYGIPYAQAPVRELRFRKPVPVDVPDNVPDVVLVRRKRFPCPQISPRGMVGERSSNENSTEECLHLNVWAPSDIGTLGRRTVLFYIHGGYFEQGSNDLPSNDGQILSADGDVVVVVPNYRLHIFGFLNAHMVTAPGNAGVYDVILALQWCIRNIAQFGGDPEKIVLVGRDAGAVIAGYLMVSPLTKGMVKRYILLSGSPFWTPPDNHGLSALTNLRALAKHFHCDREDDVESVACLSQVDLYDINDTPDIHRYRMYPSDNDELLPFFIPEGLHQVADYSVVDVLLGNVIGEGRQIASNSISISLSNLLNRTLRRFGTSYLGKFGVRSPEAAMKEYDVYGALSREATLGDIVGDFMIQCPLQFLADELSSRGRKVYYFLMDYNPWAEVLQNEGARAYHLDNSLLFGEPMEKASPQLVELSKNVIYAWTTFAKTGSLTLASGLPWPAYTKMNRTYVIFNGIRDEILHGFRERQCSFWAKPPPSPSFADLPFMKQP